MSSDQLTLPNFNELVTQPRFKTPDSVVAYLNSLSSDKRQSLDDASAASLDDTGKVIKALAVLDPRGQVTSRYLAARGAADLLAFKAGETVTSGGRQKVHVILRLLAQLGLVQRFPPQSTSNGTYRLTAGGEKWVGALQAAGLINLDRE